MAGSTKRIELRVLGPVAVTREGIECAIGGTRARALLAYLALNRRPVSPGELVTWLWVEPPPTAAKIVSGGPSRGGPDEGVDTKL